MKSTIAKRSDKMPSLHPHGMLDVDQWEFYVVGRDEITTLGQSSMGLATVARLSGGPIAFADLADAIGDSVAAN